MLLQAAPSAGVWRRRGGYAKDGSQGPRRSQARPRRQGRRCRRVVGWRGQVVALRGSAVLLLGGPGSEGPGG